MRFIATSLAVSLAVSVAPASAADTYVHAGRLLDRPGSAPRGPSTLIVRDGKVVEVKSGLVQPPAGAKLIDLSSKFVLPGLIDSHVHLASDAGGNAALIEDFTDSPVKAAYRTAGNAKKDAV